MVIPRGKLDYRRRVVPLVTLSGAGPGKLAPDEAGSLRCAVTSTSMVLRTKRPEMNHLLTKALYRTAKARALLAVRV